MMRFACVHDSEFVWWLCSASSTSSSSSPPTVPGDLCFLLRAFAPRERERVSDRTYPAHSSQIHLTFVVIICVYFVLFAIRRWRRRRHRRRCLLRRRRRLFFNSSVARRPTNENFEILFLFRIVVAACAHHQCLSGALMTFGTSPITYRTLASRVRIVSTSFGFCFAFFPLPLSLPWWVVSWFIRMPRHWRLGRSSFRFIFFFVLFHCSLLSKSVCN